MKQWKPCAKQTVRCTLVMPNGTEYSGTNKCLIAGDVCPRVLADCASGAGYELCGPPIHAEEDAIAQALASNVTDFEGVVAYLEGHTYFCPACQHALTAVGVRTFVVTGA